MEEKYFPGLLVEIPKKLKELKLSTASKDLREAIEAGRMDASEVASDVLDPIIEAFELASETEENRDITYAFLMLANNYSAICCLERGLDDEEDL